MRVHLKFGRLMWVLGCEFMVVVVVPCCEMKSRNGTRRESMDDRVSRSRLLGWPGYGRRARALSGQRKYDFPPGGSTCSTCTVLGSVEIRYSAVIQITRLGLCIEAILYR